MLILQSIQFMEVLVSMYEIDSSVILATMIASITSGADTSEGSFIYDALSPVAQEIANANVSLNEVTNKIFATTAAANGYSTELEDRAAEFGITKKNGTVATGSATFTGAETTQIPAGSIIQTTAGLQFLTVSDGVITGGTAKIAIEASEIGPSYNMPVNTITQIPTAISGITAVTNDVITSGGTDQETDAALVARLLTQVQSPSTSGNAAQYKEWALEVAGIGLAQVFPLWNGAGTVKVCAVDSNMSPLSSNLLTALTAYVESQRPIGATVTYESAAALPINISVDVVRNTAYTQAQIITSLTTSIISYLKSIYSKQNYVSYAVIGSLIMVTPGVTDYNTLTVNTGTINITIGSEQVATVGTVTVSAP